MPLKRSTNIRKKEDTLDHTIGVVKTFLDKDPMKEELQFAREEAERSREHEMRMMQMLLSMQPPPMHQHAPIQQYSQMDQHSPLHNHQQNPVDNIQFTNAADQNPRF